MARVTKAQRFENIGDLLLAVREQRDLTQEEMGALVGLGKSRISKYERGRVEPSFGILMQYLEALSVDLRIDHDGRFGIC